MLEAKFRQHRLVRTTPKFLKDPCVPKIQLISHKRRLHGFKARQLRVPSPLMLPQVLCQKQTRASRRAAAIP